MQRRWIYPALAILLLLAPTAPALATLCNFSDVVIFAFNSVHVSRDASITGDLVANSESLGPVLDEGAEVALDRGVLVTGNVSGHTVDLDRQSEIRGNATYFEIFSDGTITGAQTVASPPYTDVPAFQEAQVRPECDDVFVAAGTTEVLGDEVPRETCFDDIVLAEGGTLIFSGGGSFDVGSIQPADGPGPCPFPCQSILFDAPSDVRVVGRIDTEKNSFVGPAPGSAIDASDLVIYVGGANGGLGGPFDTPSAVHIGRNSDLQANLYAPNGTIQIDRDSTVTGALLGRDLEIDARTVVLSASAFENQAPTADDKDVFTNNQASIAIGLTGSDPEGQVLTFAKASDPGFGSVSVAGSTATYTPNDPLANAEDSFTYTATDECGAVSAPATVRVNPPGDPNDAPDDPTTEVVANDRLCDSLDPIDCSLETIQDTAITLILSGAAPCEGGFPTPGDPSDAEPCDGNGNDVPLTFSLPSLTTSQGGTLSGLDQGTGELQEPPAPDEVPQRTASVLYTPPAGFTGVDSFTFEVEGDVDGSGGIDPGAEPNRETDTATVEISVQVFTPVPPVVARDQRVSTPMDTPVIISLSGPGDCDPSGEDCRDEPQSPLTSAAESGSAATLLDPTFGAALDDTYTTTEQLPLAAAKISASLPGPVANAALPGERLFAIDSDLDELFELSPVDATSTLVGSTAAGPTTPASLAFDGVAMYTIDLGGGGLYTLNLNTGTPTLVCSTGISGWQGLASDPTDEGQFYGITQADDLYKIDRTTCTTTRVNATAGTVGGLITALEFDANGTLWGAEFGSPGLTTENAALVKIDKTTGAVTVVSGCSTRPCSGNDNFLDGFQGIDFSTDGTLYGHNTNDDSLYIIDTTDGSLTFLGSNSTIFVKGLAFSEEVLLQPGFTILTLPKLGTLSYVDPLTGVKTDITAADLPLLLPTEQVTFTPPEGATGDPLASFSFQQSDGLTIDTGLIELVVTGEIIIVDPCAEVGRPPGCDPGGAAPETGGGEASAPEFEGPSDGFTLVVEGVGGTVASSSIELSDGRFLRPLICSGECTRRFPAGETIKLFARPDGKHFVFVGWSGACSGSEPITTITLAPETRCIATFEKRAAE